MCDMLCRQRVQRAGDAHNINDAHKWEGKKTNMKEQLPGTTGEAGEAAGATLALAADLPV